MALKRVLVAYDGSEAAFRALEQAVEAVRADEGEIDLVVVGTLEITDPETVAQEAGAYLFDHGFEPQVHARFGDPAEIIRSLVADEGYDTVYLGTRGHIAHLQDGLPSVSGAVVERSPVTTVVAR